ncbi:hypothetical protein D3C79_717730 [compost metagenome]
MIDAQAHQGAVAEVDFERSVKDVAVLLVPVHEGIVELLGRDHAPAQVAGRRQRPGDVRFQALEIPGADTALHIGLELAGRALADHVDHAAGVARAGHQPGGAAHHFHPVVDGHVEQGAGHGAGLVFLVSGDAVELVGVDGAAARIDVEALAAILGHGHAGGLVEHIGHVAQLLVIHALAGDDADRLRRFAD